MKLNIQLFADGSVEIEAKLTTKRFDMQISVLEEELMEYERQAEKYANAGRKLTEEEAQDYKKLQLQIEKTSNKLADLYQRQTKLGDASSSSGMGGLLKSMTKWGLAIFSIRSAYTLIRQATNQLAQENEEIAGKLQAIRGSLTNLLAPVVEVIVNLVYRLLSYLNVLTKEFLGIDLFAKSNKGAKATLGTAQKLRKTIAGFDEMNVLNDNVSGSGGGTPKLPTPEPPDTSAFQEYVKKFKKMWEEILDIDRKSAKEVLLNSDDTYGLLKLGAFDLVQGIVFAFQGLLDFIGGFWKIVRGLATGNTELIWQGVGQLFTGIAEGLRGLIQSLYGVFEIAVGLGYGLGKEIGEVINKVKGFISSFVQTFITSITQLGITIGKNIVDKIKGLPNKFDEIKDKLKKNFSGGFWKGIANTFIDIMNSAINKLNSKFSFTISDNVASLLKGLGIKAKAGKYQIIKIPTIPKLAKGGIINMPGRGLPIGNAIAGESGREGILPLTDSQQMALLGEAIGRYITINANITNTMNGRIISRELQKIQQENNFAGNR